MRPLLERDKSNTNEVTRLPEKSTTIFEYNLCAENKQQENSCTQNVYQVGKIGEDPNRDACVSMVCHVASTSCYQRLRTEEQLGYIVQAALLTPLAWLSPTLCIV